MTGTGGSPAWAGAAWPAEALPEGLPASTSRAMTRPPGPDPRRIATSRPFSRAIFRASGEILTRSPDEVVEATVVACRAAGAEVEDPLSEALAGAGLGELSALAAACGFASDAPSSAGGCSPLASSNARREPMGTFSPSLTRNRCRMPSSNASISMVALSVSTSAMTSPTRTLSPSFFFHFRRVPSVMVSASLGISM